MSSTAQNAEGEKILIVDDDPGLSSLLERFFTSKGYRARAVPNTEQMDRLLAREVFHLVVLDLMLPGEDGLTACRRLRAANNQVPIIMLTAKGDELSRIKGLELGADDYLAKPFNPDELMARVKAVLRRQSAPVPGAPGSEDESVTFGDYELSLATRELKRGDWVEFGEGKRERLNWISPQRGILLFSNHQSAKAISIAPDALARQIRDGAARIVRDEEIFERALSGALDSVNAA